MRSDVIRFECEIVGGIARTVLDCPRLKNRRNFESQKGIRAFRLSEGTSDN